MRSGVGKEVVERYKTINEIERDGGEFFGLKGTVGNSSEERRPEKPIRSCLGTVLIHHGVSPSSREVCAYSARALKETGAGGDMTNTGVRKQRKSWIPAGMTSMCQPP